MLGWFIDSDIDNKSERQLFSGHEISRTWVD